MNNLSLVNIFGETGQFFYNINYMLNSEHLSLVNKIGDKTEFTITRVHCIYFIVSYILFVFLTYSKVASSNTFRLKAHAGFLRLLMKEIFDPYVL